MDQIINKNIYNNFVYKTKYNFNIDNIRPICDILLNEHSKYPKEEIHINSYSSFHSKLQPHNQVQFSKFYDFIKPIYLDLLINKWGYPDDLNYEVGLSWINTYSDDGYIKEHTHVGHNCVCVCSSYILHKKNAGNLLFKDPYYEYKNSIIQNKDDNWLYKSVEIEEGDVVFFQSAVGHKSEPNRSGQERLVLSSNIYISNKNLI